MKSPSIVVISGLPGSGKTTTARALAARFERGAHVEADALQGMIRSGLNAPDGLSKPHAGSEADTQRRLRLSQACLVARSFVDAGFTAVVDDIVIASKSRRLT